MYIYKELFKCLIDRLAFHQTGINLFDYRVTVDKCPLEIIAHEHPRCLTPVTLSQRRKFKEIINLLISIFDIWCDNIDVIHDFKLAAICDDTDMSFVIFARFQTGCIKCKSYIELFGNKRMLIKPKHIATVIYHRLDHMIVGTAYREDTLIHCS